MTASLPARLTVRQAAEALSVGPATVRRLVRVGQLSAVYPHGRGVGKRFYLDPAEVEAYARGGARAAAAHRSKRTKARKGR